MCYLLLSFVTKYYTNFIAAEAIKSRLSRNTDFLMQVSVRTKVSVPTQVDSLSVFIDAPEHATFLPGIQPLTYLLRSPPDLFPPGRAAEMFLLRLARLPFLCVGAV